MSETQVASPATGASRGAPPRHLLRDDDLSPAEQAVVLELAAQMKADPFARRPLQGPQVVALIFDKPTLRTQASFAAGVAELGGFPMVVDGALAGIGTRESVADTARVLGRQSGAIVWRTFAQDDLEEMADHAGVPVVNALTDDLHPCQALADLLTVREHRGPLPGQTLAFLGDAASNMSHSLLLAGATAGMHVRVSGPEGYTPEPRFLDRAREVAGQTGGSVAVLADPDEAASGAGVLVTDTWVSMGREEQAAQRAEVFDAWRLDSAMVARGRKDAVVLHCLPAYRGREVTAEVLDGPRSLVWEEAENRRHVQKAVLAFLLDPHLRGEVGER